MQPVISQLSQYFNVPVKLNTKKKRYYIELHTHAGMLSVIDNSMTIKNTCLIAVEKTRDYVRLASGEDDNLTSRVITAVAKLGGIKRDANAPTVEQFPTKDATHLFSDF